MHESFISRAALLAAMLWTTTAVLVGAVWGLALLEVSSHWTRPVAVTACVTAAIAVACQLRLGQIRLCAVVRATAGIEKPEPSADLRAVR